MHKFLSFVTALLLFLSCATSLPAQDVASKGSGYRPTPFTDLREMRNELERARDIYDAFLRSYPEPVEHRDSQIVTGEWRFAYEVQPFIVDKETYRNSLTIPEPPAWSKTEFDDSAWEPVQVPEWRYHFGETFRLSDSFIGWYRVRFHARDTNRGRAFLRFGGVDWRAQVWLNGEYLGTHVTYFEPFWFDVTEHLLEENVLTIRLIDGPAYAEPVSYWGPFPCPDTKLPIYTESNQDEFLQALTGPEGPDGPMGMSTCIGNGGGIFRPVELIRTGETVIENLFARADTEAKSVAVRIETDALQSRKAEFRIEILPENFKAAPAKHTVEMSIPLGKSAQTVSIPLPEMHTWSPHSPQMYRCRVRIVHGNDVVDGKDILFGCRSFTIDGESKEANHGGGRPGQFRLNGELAFLRGVNVHGMNMLYFWGEREKLIDSLLMLKIANFNMIRSCQHVQFPEVRELLDRFGIMSEQDQGFGNPHCGHTPYSGLTATAAPLARVCYNNPGVVLLSFGNETPMPTDVVKRITDRILEVDPERILKPGSDLATRETPLPEGYPETYVYDFHTYEGWYGSEQGTPFTWTRRFDDSEAMRVNTERKLTMGEFGAEAMDAFATMKDVYPPQFSVPDRPSEDLLRGFQQVQKDDIRQRVGLRGLTATDLSGYIEASQSYQRLLLREMMTAARISAARIAGTMMFYFADPLPGFWGKAVVSPDLRPKKAYFTMAKLNRPVVPLFQMQPNGNRMELWVGNDTPETVTDARLSWILHSGDWTWLSGTDSIDIPASRAVHIITLDLTPIRKEDRRLVRVRLKLIRANGEPLSYNQDDIWLDYWRRKEAVFEP